MTFNFIRRCVIVSLLAAGGQILLVSSVSRVNITNPILIEWKQITTGLYYAEIPGPYTSKFSDSKVSILKIDPAYYDFVLANATQFDSTQKTIKDWCDTLKLNAAINAGMYSLKDHVSATGYMKTYEHTNNPVFKEGFNALAVFNPKIPSQPSFRIIDMVNQDWRSIKEGYNSCFQSIRMIDNRQKGIYWKKKPLLRCSMSVLAMDKEGKVLFLFSRSPYNANEYIDFMLKSPLHIQTAMYLEGGPEASLYMKTDSLEIIKFGSYVSFSCPNDDNMELRKMPNILGIRKK
jgi:hypothetical protein